VNQHGLSPVLCPTTAKHKSLNVVPTNIRERSANKSPRNYQEAAAIIADEASNIDDMTAMTGSLAIKLPRLLLDCSPVITSNGAASGRFPC
jgi:hypothetical protein